MKSISSIWLTVLLALSVIANIAIFLIKSSDNGAASLDEKIFAQLRGHASFNAVFIIIAIIFIGLIITLIRIDRKVSRLEKEMKGPKS
jgi:hypothetical protein